MEEIKSVFWEEVRVKIGSNSVQITLFEHLNNQDFQRRRRIDTLPIKMSATSR